MEELCDTGDLFYMGAQTEWLPAEKFENINNWDDALKPAASHYIKEVEEWIASVEDEKEKGHKSAGDGNGTNIVVQKRNESALFLESRIPAANVERHLLRSPT